MEMLTFKMRTNGEDTVVMAPSRKAAVAIAEQAYRTKHGLPASVQVLASVVAELNTVPVTATGLVGVR